MRRLATVTVIIASLTGPALAQDITMPTITMPEPGTFCAPFQLCVPLVTRDVRD
jgi:hypothetical protein